MTIPNYCIYSIVESSYPSGAMLRDWRPTKLITTHNHNEYLLRPLHETEFIVIPAKAGIQLFKKINEINSWIPAFAGMTK